MDKDRKYRYARITPQAAMKDFPIGKIINWGSKRHLKYNVLDKVEGYIFDGEYWYPAYDTWDGWCPFYGDDEEDETYEPLQNSEEDLEWMKAL